MDKGYKLKHGQFLNKEFGYLAGNDDERRSDLVSMFQNPIVNAIFISRGGYGTHRLLDKIDYTTIQNNPKILLGYSDITALQCALLKKCNLVTFSGPMVSPEFGEKIGPLTDFYCWEILTQSKALVFDPAVFGLVPKLYKKGTASGQLIAGNLTVLCSLLGTDYLPSFKNAILIIEDIGEDVYKIDRSLNQLKLAGILAQLNGLVFGQFTNCTNSPKTPIPSIPLEKVLEEYAEDLEMPVMGNFPYGHERKKFTLPVGVNAELDTNRGIIKMLGPGIVI